MRLSLRICHFTILLACITPKSGAACASPFSAGFTFWSLIGGLAGEIGGVGGVTAGYTDVGQGVTFGSAVVTLVDPENATFLNGQISIDYNPSKLAVVSYGWLGDWGADTSLLPPPVTEGDTIPEGTVIQMQSPNSSLNVIASVDNNLGNITVGYDWGSSGHSNVLESGHLNMLAILFVTKAELSHFSEFYEDVQFNPDLNFNYAIPAGSDTPQLCGCPPVPEASVFGRASLCILAALALARRIRQRATRRV